MHPFHERFVQRSWSVRMVVRITTVHGGCPEKNQRCDLMNRVMSLHKFMYCLILLTVFRKAAPKPGISMMVNLRVMLSEIDLFPLTE